MGWLDVVILALNVMLEMWKYRTDPTQAKLRAAAYITKDLSDDIESFDKALKDNDAKAISVNFELLRDRINSLPKEDNGGGPKR